MIDSGVTTVYGIGRPAVELKSTMETSEPVPESATRKDLVAVRTAPVAFDEAMDPDSSSTSITLIPQRSTRS